MTKHIKNLGRTWKEAAIVAERKRKCAAINSSGRSSIRINGKSYTKTLQEWCRFYIIAKRMSELEQPL